MRIHSDYHLGQVLYTGNDFYILDFEGEPILPISERRLKRSALADVAGMVRSFHYAATTALFEHKSLQGEISEKLEPFVDIWFSAVKGVFLKAYREGVKDQKGLIPADEKKFETLLNAYILHKAVYEVGYELQNRPDWVVIPLKGLLTMLESGK
jgi:maltose alpha-D-glucosyltransferase/alpha-amylase